jgi:superoxide dismutase, Cu-Zn family
MVGYAIALGGMLAALGVGVLACEGERASGELRGRGVPVAQPTVVPGEPTRPGAPLETTASPAPSRVIEARLEGKTGADVQGTATLTQEKDGVRIFVDVTRAPPGKHGLHVHEKGDCSDPKAERAGEHLALPGQSHGVPIGRLHDGADPSAKVHLGDLGNIEIARDGTGHLEHVVRGGTLEPGKPTSFANRAIILHDHEDTGGDPSGHAGGRIACAVTRTAAP